MILNTALTLILFSWTSNKDLWSIIEIIAFRISSMSMTSNILNRFDTMISCSNFLNPLIGNIHWWVTKHIHRNEIIYSHRVMFIYFKSKYTYIHMYVYTCIYSCWSPAHHKNISQIYLHIFKKSEKSTIKVKRGD